MILKHIAILSFLVLLLFSCKRQFACWCTAKVTVDGVTTIHKYQEAVVAKTRKEGKKRCEKYAQDTKYSEIECELYDY